MQSINIKIKIYQMFCIFWCTIDGNRNLTLTTHILETHSIFCKFSWRGCVQCMHYQKTVSPYPSKSFMPETNYCNVMEFGTGYLQQQLTYKLDFTLSVIFLRSVSSNTACSFLLISRDNSNVILLSSAREP